ncbi:GNAT family N-acetyltransferase [Cohnella herbarum]|uniref:GNAT family N-acetyltransferase n=1 Tax=Cohnella herbarum TaxID=2728023 RepID=A0A7Z2ZKM5_9BACL|nr:GNAT family N-acetyltransferase [Cohnella herbarum]QJD83000.1 GNAT family N-acetyltransferase [Cohnella herbarum]
MLTKQRLQEIERLQQECERHDGIQLKLNWDMLKKRESDQLDFFYYENDELAAFLGLYDFGSTVEVCGMVKPRERRKGHFDSLFHQGMNVAKQQGYKKILLNAPTGSEAAKAFLNKQGAEYAFSEHQMKWQQRPIEEAEGIILREATADDYKMRVRLTVTAFGLEEADAQEIENRVDQDSEAEMLMIEADGETVGKIRVDRQDGEAWLYGFSVLPERQGKGIGRKALRRVIKQLSATGHSVHLEVETKNDQALGLYESVGFKAVHSQDYYRYPF